MAQANPTPHLVRVATPPETDGARTPLEVLIVEDVAHDAELLVQALRDGGFELRWRSISTEPDFLAALEAPCDVILADYTLPQFSAQRVLELVRQRDSRVPVIIVTASISEETAIQCIRQGAADYLLKDRLSRLAQAVRSALAHRAMCLAEQRTQEQIGRSEQRYRHILDAAADAIISINGHGLICELNRAVETLFGYTRAELLGAPVTAIVPQRLRPLHTKGVRRYLRTGQRRLPSWRGVRMAGLTKAGREVPLEVSLSEHWSGNDQLLTAVLRDVSERQQAEEALRRKTDQLTAVTDVMTAFLISGDWRAASAWLLHSALEQTSSKYGFIGVLTPAGALRVLAHEGIIWDDQINRAFYMGARCAPISSWVTWSSRTSRRCSAKY